MRSSWQLVTLTMQSMLLSPFLISGDFAQAPNPMLSRATFQPCPREQKIKPTGMPEPAQMQRNVSHPPQPVVCELLLWVRSRAILGTDESAGSSQWARGNRSQMIPRQRGAKGIRGGKEMNQVF